MLFGTSGIRGDAEKLFTDQFCFDIGRTFSRFLDDHGMKDGIAIGMDPRESSTRIKDHIIDGLLCEGRWVFDQRLSPSPAMNYILIVDHNIVGSIMVTGSHIRAEFNGIKFFAFEKEILKEHEKEIEKIYNEIREEISYGYYKKEIRMMDDRIVSDRANKSYHQMLLNLAEDYPPWRIVLDLGNGCQSKIMPGLFKKLGLDVITINDDPRPDKFITRDTETEDAVKDLQAKVKEVGADFGIAFDGDGDRAVFVDKYGRFIPGDYSGSLIAKYSDCPIIVTPVNTSQVIEHIGKTVVRTKVGSPYVVEAILKNNAAFFGFEANGGGISKEVMLSRDAGSTAIKILNILSRNNKTLDDMIGELPQFFICRTKIDCPTNIYPIILEMAKEKFKGIRIDDIDGLKIWKNDDSWILFRPSSNEPAFRVFTEATTEEDAVRLCEEGEEFVIHIRDNNM